MTQLHEIEVVQKSPLIERQAVINGWNYLYYFDKFDPVRSCWEATLSASANVADPAAPHVIGKPSAEQLAQALKDLVYACERLGDDISATKENEAFQDAMQSALVIAHKVTP